MVGGTNIASWRDSDNFNYVFPCIIKGAPDCIKRIHPYKQQEVYDIYKALSGDRRVRMLGVFGSAASIRCNGQSDLDVIVDLAEPSQNDKNEISEIIQECTDWDCDVIWLDRVDRDSQLWNNIRKGVRII